MTAVTQDVSYGFDPWPGNVATLHDKPGDPLVAPMGWTALRPATREQVGGAAVAILRLNPDCSDPTVVAYSLWEQLRLDRKIEADLGQPGIAGPIRLLSSVLTKLLRAPDPNMVARADRLGVRIAPAVRSREAYADLVSVLNLTDAQAARLRDWIAERC